MNSQTVNRKCKHDMVTMGDISKCKDCTIEKLEEKLIFSSYLVARLSADNKNYLDDNTFLRKKYADTLAYINAPFVVVFYSEAERRLSVYYKVISSEIKRFTRDKKPLIIDKIKRIRQVILK